jgi:hypothetical protein
MSIQGFTLKADLDADGEFEEDWSPYLLAVKDCGLGRRAAVAKFPPAKATFVLNNADSRFSPRNTAGPYYPDLKKGTRVQLASQVTIAALTNKVLNPSFETGTTSWAVSGSNTLVKSDEQARKGRYSGKATYQSSVTMATYSITLTAAQHAVSVYLYIPTNWDGGTISLQAILFTGATGTLSVNADMSIRDRWQRVSLVFTPAGGDLTGTFAIIAASAPTVGRSIETGASASLYCDGDQPACSWAGTAHASQSSRTANPTFTKFTGELRELGASRSRMEGRAEFRATGINETTMGMNISCGPFGRKPADMVLQRVLDILEGVVSERILGLNGEAMRDGAFRFGGDAWATAVGTPVAFSLQKDTGSGNDPVSYTALEGDQVMELSVDSSGDGREHTIQSQITNEKPYHVSCFVLAANSGANGKRVKLTAIGTITPAVTATAILDLAVWKYISLTITFAAGETTARVRMTADEDFTGIFWTDGVHVSPVYAGSGTPQTIQNSVLGTKWATTTIEHLARYRKRAGLVLDELVASAGGWYREAGDGSLVFEDYSTRDPLVSSYATLRLSDAVDDGMSCMLTNYEEPPSSLGRTVRVSSHGDLSALSAPAGDHAKTIWMLGGTLPVALGANELRTFFADYPQDGEAGSLIARRARAIAIPLTGWTADDGIATPYPINYGEGGDVLIRSSAGGQDVYALSLGARVLARQATEQSVVEVGSGDPVMDLEMPGQGTKTQAMTDLATWAEAKYGGGVAVPEVVIYGNDTEALLDILGREIGEPVWLKHKTGQGHFGIEGLFYIEGLRLDAAAEDAPSLTLTLEEAA